jgi:hypothetical protein
MSSTSSPDWAALSPAASSSAELERGYRRLIAFYPRSFRKQNAEEILAVLLATAHEGQRRPGFAEAADLLRGAARMRMGLSRAPRTVLNAVRLMYLGGVAHLAVLITILVTAGDVRSAVRSAVLQHDHAVSAVVLGKVLSTVSAALIVNIVACALLTVAWLWLAYLTGMGSAWARVLALIACGFSTMAVGINMAQGDATYAPAAMIASGVVWAIGLAAVTLLMWKPSWSYFEQRTAAAE